MLTLPEELPSPQDQSHSSINNKNKYYCCFWLYLKSEKQTNITMHYKSHNLIWPHYYQLLLQVRNAKWIPFIENIYLDIDIRLLAEINSSNWLFGCGVAGPILGADICISGSFKLEERSQKPRYIIFIGPGPEWSRVCFHCIALALSIIDFELCWLCYECNNGVDNPRHPINWHENSAGNYHRIWLNGRKTFRGISKLHFTLSFSSWRINVHRIGNN